MDMMDRFILHIYHHESHEESDFYSSSFENAAIITFDGVGELATTTYQTWKCSLLYVK